MRVHLESVVLCKDRSESLVVFFLLPIPKEVQCRNAKLLNQRCAKLAHRSRIEGQHGLQGVKELNSGSGVHLYAELGVSRLQKRKDNHIKSCTVA